MNEIVKYISDQKPERHYTSENEFWIELQYEDSDLYITLALSFMVIKAGVKHWTTEDGFEIVNSKSEGAGYSGMRSVKLYFRLPHSHKSLSRKINVEFIELK